MEDIRWEQRFQNYKKALTLLRDASAKLSITDIERAGYIQYFEITVELGWKVLKDWLAFGQYPVTNSPREVIKVAFEAGIISDGHTWMDALDARNQTVHTYDEEKALAAEHQIRHFFLPIFMELENDLDKRVSR